MVTHASPPEMQPLKRDPASLEMSPVLSQGLYGEVGVSAGTARVPQSQPGPLSAWDTGEEDLAR